ncbi:hypothetical protein KAR91_12965 [Candidatus Pacearchaeota archaeon]|nr:hypothetical protein [Candidatus Pacearchaeota archaeon]
MATLRIVSKKPKFQRIFRLTIGIGPDQVVIEDLGDDPRSKRLTFAITSALQSYTQGATFQIYNLGIDTIKKISTIKSPVVFQAGYKEVHGDKPPVIYNGNVQYPNSLKVGTDIVTTLTCQAYRDSLSGPLAVSYEDGTAITSILEEVRGDILDPEGNVLPIEIIGASDLGNITDDLNSGSMNKQQFLDELGKNHGFNWWCDTITKQMIVVPVGKALRENEILIVNNDTGLMKSPEITANGITFETLLEPSIRYMSLIQVEYENITSSFIIGTDINELRNVRSAIIKAVNISHTGDSRSDDWKSTVMGNWFSTGLPVTNIG